jgi:lipopolysaccharide export system protein LptA
MRRSALVPAVLLALAAASAPAAAQNECNLVRQQGTWSSIGDPANRVISAQGPLTVTCTNGEVLRADSAVIYQTTHEVQLFRQVDYQDPTRSLTSDNATYNSVTGRLYATGNVVFVDKQKGSTLRGPELEYFRPIPGRPEAQMTALQRPHVTVRPKSGSGAATTRRREPMEIDADRVSSVGDRNMTATGNVVIVDNGTRSTADEAFYDQVADHVELRRNARVDNEKYHLTGELIVSDLKDGSVSKVVAQTNARLVSERLTVSGPQLQLFFERDLLQRMVSGQVPGTAPARDTAAARRDSAAAAPRDTGAARTPAPPSTGIVRPPGQPQAPPSTPTATPPATGPVHPAGRPATPPAGRAPGDSAAAHPAGPAQPASEPARPPLAPGFRSVAVAKGFRMEADSLEAILPDQRLRRVNAVGSARGESWDTVAVRTVRVDSGGAAGVAAPPASMTEPPKAYDQKDLLTGDTIIAFFRDSLAADSARRAGTRDSVRLAGRPAAPPPAPGDTAKTEIERLLAIGNAHSLYRMRADSTRPRETKQGLNYLIGDRIDLTFKAGEVDVAHVRGLKQGMYLDPDNGAPADSAAADTSAAGRRRAAARAAGRAPAGQPAARPGAARSGSPPANSPLVPPPPAPPPPPRPPTRELPQVSLSTRGSKTAASRPAPATGGPT